MSNQASDIIFCLFAGFFLGSAFIAVLVNVIPGSPVLEYKRL